MVKKILDVGCGGSKIVGAIGIDRLKLPGVDIVHNLDEFPWPIMSQSINHIVFCHSISHLSNVTKVIEECERILVDGGIIEIIAPHFSSDNYYTDPTHLFSLGIRSMNYFVKNVEFDYKYIEETKLLKLSEAAISFREHRTVWRENKKLNVLKIIGFELLVNKFPRLYEKFFAHIIPASEVYFVLKK